MRGAKQFSGSNRRKLHVFTKAVTSYTRSFRVVSECFDRFPCFHSQSQSIHSRFHFFGAFISIPALFVVRKVIWLETLALFNAVFSPPP